MKIVTVLVALLLAGCATEGQYQPGAMLPGRIIALSDGTTFPMQYEFTSGSGKMTARNPITGELFQGTYTAILETHTVQNTNTSIFDLSDDDSQSVSTSDVAQGTAVLVGNKGTVLNLKLHVKVGNPPTGFGEGEDNKGGKYSVQF